MDPKKIDRDSTFVEKGDEWMTAFVEDVTRSRGPGVYTAACNNHEHDHAESAHPEIRMMGTITDFVMAEDSTTGQLAILLDVAPTNDPNLDHVIPMHLNFVNNGDASVALWSLIGVVCCEHLRRGIEELVAAHHGQTNEDC